jgi:Putative zinc-finger
MTDSLGCHQVREVAPELALGVLAGQERAAALQHLAGCGSCRRHLAELAEVADELLLLAPSREPPVGFESRVVGRLTGRPPTARRRRLATIAAAAALAAALTAIGFRVATDQDRELAARYRHALQQANGQYFGAVPLRDASGHRAGSVFGYQGSPPWVFVVVNSSSGSGTYAVEVTTRDGRRLQLGTLTVTDGKGSWGRALPVALRDIARVRLARSDGATGFEAAFRRPSR